MRVLVLGGTGVISRCIVEQLLAKNHAVSVFNRGNKRLPFHKDVEQITGNRQDWEAFESAMQARQFDAVIDMICFNAEDAKSTIRAFRDNVSQIIVTSSIAAYKRPYRSVPTREQAEVLWDDPAFPYAFHKAEMERYLQQVMQRENLPVTIIRPSLTYGPGAANIGVLRQNYGIIDRIQRDKPLVMFGDGTTPWNFTFAPDLAKAYLAVLGNSGAFRKAYHVTNEDRHIWEDLYLEFGRIVGKQPKIIHIASELLYKAAPNLCNHLFFEKTYAGLFDNSKIQQDAPEFKAEIDLAAGLHGIYEWYLNEAGTVDPEKDALEDKLAEAYVAMEKSVSNLYTK